MTLSEAYQTYGRTPAVRLKIPYNKQLGYIRNIRKMDSIAYGVTFDSDKGYEVIVRADEPVVLEG